MISFNIIYRTYINLITNTIITKNISFNEKPLFEIEPVFPGDPDYKIFEERSKNAKYFTFEKLLRKILYNFRNGFWKSRELCPRLWWV